MRQQAAEQFVGYLFRAEKIADMIADGSADKIAASTRTIETELAELSRMGIIHRVRDKNGGHWEIINSVNLPAKHGDETKTRRKRDEDDTETDRTVLGRTTEEKHNECIISSWQGGTS